MFGERNMLWSVMTGVLLLVPANIADAQETDGPVIVRPPKNEIILQNGQNYTLECRGKRPVNITQQDIPEEPTGDFYMELRNGSSDNEYWVKLDLYNVDQFAVGYYACFDNTINSNEILRDIVEEPKNTKHVSYTYVYVNGSTLFAPMRALIVAKSNSTFLVECKPTSPDIQVRLIPDFADIKHEQYQFNPKVGFIVDSDVVFMSDSLPTTFTCSYEKHGKVDSQFVVVQKHINLDPPKPRVYGGEPYFLEGDSFSINCTVNRQINIPVNLKWNFPGNGDKVTFESNSNDNQESNTVLFSQLNVKNASKEDAGNYTCVFNSMHDKKTFSSFEKKFLDEPILNISKREYKIDLDATAQTLIQLKTNIYAAYPPLNVTVTRENITLPSDGKKYVIKVKEDIFIFKIFRLSAEDTGIYVFNFSNGYRTEIVEHFIAVSAPPRVTFVLTKKYVMGRYASIPCKAVGYPLPEIEWIFIDEEENVTHLEQGSLIKIENKEKSKAVIESTLTLPVNVPGNIMCKATNSINSTNVIRRFLVYEIDEGFGIVNADKMWFSEKESVTLKCLASIYDYDNVTWYDEYDNEITSERLYENELSLVAELNMDPITVSQAGLYYCKGTKIDGSEVVTNVTVTVAKIQPPYIWGLAEETREVNQSEEVNISCVADAIPPPTIKWYKDDSPLEFNSYIIENEEVHINRTTVNSTISIHYMQTNYAGKYECYVKSNDNIQIKTFQLVVKEPLTHKTIYLSVAGVIFFILILVVIYLTWRIRKEKQFRKELAAAGLLYFKEGVTKSINPDLGIDEQAELLPYDDKFEFPPEKLKLGKQLGAGAFGVVYKAEARGIVNAEETTTVAVKMVKKTADNMYIKALASELKIMVHLGKHINIVNLLGACTKNVGKRELIVIVEYCKFGNIHDYLFRHREVYIDQLNDNSEKVLGKVNRGYSCSSGNSAMNSDYCGSNNTQQTDHTFLNTANTNRSGRKDNQIIKGPQNKQLELAKVSESGYLQPEWRSNYDSDYSYDGRNPRPLCSRDLLAWSFQIARGMEYLASRKILHGDLAARNILLADDNVVKICDFGLARSIYKNDEYQKKENSPLPVKWLAIECMTDRIFTTQSDVWSFGIVLWELFSLAKTPYPNIDPNNLLQYLAEGHRLEKPAYADDKLYGVMKRCWLQKPTARPSFTQLQEIIGSFLEENVRNHYVDLNATYMDMNVKKAGEEDYLAMVSAPDYNNLVTPSPPHHYVNDANSFFPPTPTQHLQHDDEGYLQMSPASRQTLFNARPQGTKFDFDARKLTPRGSEANSYGSESTPMLTLNNLPRSGSESDQEGNTSPLTNNVFPKIDEETDDDVFGTKENNARNMLPNHVTNPGYIMLSIVDDKKPKNLANNYMNVQNGLVK